VDFRFLIADCRQAKQAQQTDDRGQRSEVRGQRSEVRDLEILNQLPLGFA